MLKSLLFPVVTKRHVERKVLRTAPSHLFRIIQDVDAYSQFLPLCSYSKILKRSTLGDNFEASLTVGLPPLFSETYISRVQVYPETLTVHTKSIESNLFDSLESRWKLSPVNTKDDENLHCNVDFMVEMSVSDPVIAGALDKVLEEVAGRQVAAFERRCHQIPVKEVDLLENMDQ